MANQPLADPSKLLPKARKNSIWLRETPALGAYVDPEPEPEPAKAKEEAAARPQQGTQR